MRRQDIALLVGVAVITGAISLVLAGRLFNSPTQRSEKVPQVETISTAFPDVKNDPAYQAFFNSRALDPTQTIQIGSNNNKQPF